MWMSKWWPKTKTIEGCAAIYREMRRKLKIWHMCNNIMVNIFTKKNIFLILFYIAGIAIWMSNFDNFDIDQKPSKFAQR